MTATPRFDRAPCQIVIEREAFARRIAVKIEPRTVTWPTAWFALDENADEAAARLRDKTGFPIVDRRSEAA